MERKTLWRGHSAIRAPQKNSYFREGIKLSTHLHRRQTSSSSNALTRFSPIPVLIESQELSNALCSRVLIALKNKANHENFWANTTAHKNRCSLISIPECSVEVFRAFKKHLNSYLFNFVPDTRLDAPFSAFSFPVGH